MGDVSTARLYVLRAGYLLIAVGLGAMMSPGVLHHHADLDHCAGSYGAAGGRRATGSARLRYPLQKLPLLLFELAWKSTGLVAFGLPRWAGPGFDAGTRATWADCLFGVAFCALVIPWGYVWARYVRLPGDRWSSTSPSTRTPAEPQASVRRSPA